ncbi:hypothetical protein NQZ68_022382 [Dissostichus eleginoides]|nr:hypothetical protein NQZ68_022382 [Dissostichus eleginoides]
MRVGARTHSGPHYENTLSPVEQQTWRRAEGLQRRGRGELLLSGVKGGRKEALTDSETPASSHQGWPLQSKQLKPRTGGTSRLKAAPSADPDPSDLRRDFWT